MAIETRTLASELGTYSMKSKEDIAILFATRDNKSFCINVTGSDANRADGNLPNQILLTEKPLDNYKLIARIVSDEAYSKTMFGSRCRVIANSIEDKLKSFAILKELRHCL